MGGLVEAQIVRAIDGLMSSDIAKLDNQRLPKTLVNAMEVAWTKNVSIIARRQPAASDLRMVITVIKTIPDLGASATRRKSGAHGQDILLADRVHTAFVKSRKWPKWRWPYCARAGRLCPPGRGPARWLWPVRTAKLDEEFDQLPSVGDLR